MQLVWKSFRWFDIGHSRLYFKQIAQNRTCHYLLPAGMLLLCTWCLNVSGPFFGSFFVLTSPGLFQELQNQLAVSVELRSTKVTTRIMDVASVSPLKAHNRSLSTFGMLSSVCVMGVTWPFDINAHYGKLFEAFTKDNTDWTNVSLWRRLPAIVGTLSTRFGILMIIRCLCCRCISLWRALELNWKHSTSATPPLHVILASWCSFVVLCWTVKDNSPTSRVLECSVLPLRYTLQRIAREIIM